MSNDEYKLVESDSYVLSKVLCGYILDNKYIFFSKLSNGAYGDVWKVYNVKEEKFYAAKVHYFSVYKYGKWEYKNYMKFKKNNVRHIANVYAEYDIELDEDFTCHCFIMDLYKMCIYDYIKKYRLRGVTIEDAIITTRNVLEFLSDIKQLNLMHNDIKPENILVDYDDDTDNKIIKKIKKLKSIDDISKYFKDKNDNDDDNDDVSDDVSDDDNSDNNSDNDSDNNSDDDDNDYNDNDKKRYDDTIDIDLSELLSDGSCSEYDESDYSESESELNVPKIKKIIICDIGTCIRENKINKPLKSLYYLSPEMLLKLYHDSKSDVWALGCTIYEILTGICLFNCSSGSEKSKNIKLHLEMMFNTLGPIPKHIVDKSPRKEFLFTTDGDLKITKNAKCNNYFEKLISVYKDNELIYKLIDLLLSMMDLDKDKRISVKDALVICENWNH